MKPRKILFRFSLGRHEKKHTVPIWCYPQHDDRLLFMAKLFRVRKDAYGLESYMEKSYSLKDLKRKIWMAERTQAGD